MSRNDIQELTKDMSYADWLVLYSLAQSMDKKNFGALIHKMRGRKRLHDNKWPVAVRQGLVIYIIGTAFQELDNIIRLEIIDQVFQRLFDLLIALSTFFRYLSRVELILDKRSR